MDSQTAPSTKEKQDEDPFQSGGLKQPLVFSASNFVVKRGRGERGRDRWEGTHMKRRRNFSQNLPLRQVEAHVWYARRFWCPSWGVRGFHSVRACGATHAQRGRQVASGEDEPDIRGYQHLKGGSEGCLLGVPSMNTSLGYL